MRESRLYPEGLRRRAGWRRLEMVEGDRSLLSTTENKLNAGDKG